MKILKILIISFILLSCKSEEDKIIKIISSENGTKWYVSELFKDRRYNPYSVEEYFTNGIKYEYTHYLKIGELVKRTDLDNKENQWKIKNNVITFYMKNLGGKYERWTQKVIYYVEDTIIMRNQYDNLIIFIKYDSKYHKK